MPSEDQWAEFTGSSLRELLREKRIIRGSYKLPTQEDCDLLAAALNALTRQVGRRSRRKPIKNPLAGAVGRRKAKLMTSTSPMRMFDRPPLAEKEEEDLAWTNLEQARRCYADGKCSAGLVRLRQFELKIARFPFRPDWELSALDLADLFAAAMERANPGLPLKLANRGPVVRFVAAVTPYIFGQNPSLDAVARRLQRAGVRRDQLLRDGWRPSRRLVLLNPDPAMLKAAERFWRDCVIAGVVWPGLLLGAGVDSYNDTASA